MDQVYWALRRLCRPHIKGVYTTGEAMSEALCRTFSCNSLDDTSSESKNPQQLVSVYSCSSILGDLGGNASQPGYRVPKHEISDIAFLSRAAAHCAAICHEDPCHESSRYATTHMATSTQEFTYDFHQN